MYKPKAISNESSFSSFNHQKDYYLSGPHKRAWAHLNFAIKQGNGILLLSGQEGSGKSTLVHSFTKKLKDNGREFTFFSAISNFDELYKVVDQSLVVIDDAELLSTKQFLILSDCIESANEQLNDLQFLLIGSEKLEQLISDTKHSNVRKKVVFSYQLGLMNAADTMKYAQLQLAAKGWHVNSEVARELLRDLYDCSSGNPELINHYLDQLQAANELHNVQHIALNRNNVSPALNEDNLSSNVALDDLSDTHPDSSTISNGIPWYRSKKLKAVGLGYLASILIAVLVFHSTTLFDQNSVEKDQELAAVNQSTPAVLPVSSIKKDSLVKDDVVDIEKANVAKIEKPTSIAKVIVEPSQEPQGITRIKNKPPVQKSANQIVSVAEAPQSVKKEATVVVEKKQNLVAKAPIDLDKLFNASEEKSTVVDENEKTAASALTHSQEVELQLVTSKMQLPSELEKLFRQEFSPELDKIKLNRLVANFEVAYEFGDLEKIDKLFLETIKSNQIEGKKALKNEYKKLFNITQSRSIRIYDLLWSKEGNSILGKGAFKVTIFERGSAQKSVFTGNIDLRVIETNQSFMFSELFYNYGTL